jgi:protein-S-isoprenylcysteine O-methyltransferase Ste14
MWFLPIVPEPPFLSGSLRIVLGITLACIGQAISVSGMVAFRRARTTINPVKPSAASSLVSSGVYRFTRNPMYVGLLLTLAGWAVYCGNALNCIALPAFAWYITQFQIKPEERVLMSLFGEHFTKYMSQVRRWV